MIASGTRLVSLISTRTSLLGGGVIGTHPSFGSSVVVCELGGLEVELEESSEGVDIGVSVVVST